mgnify:FL=1
MAIFLKRYRWNIAISGLFLLGMLIDKNGLFAKKSDPRTFTNFCLAGIACFWCTSYMFWWRFSKKIPFDAKRKIAQNRDKPWRGNPDYTFIGKVEAEAVFIVNWAKLYLEDRGDVALALFLSMVLGWILFVGAMILIFGFDLTLLIGIKYQFVILIAIWTYVGIMKKPL